MMSEKNDEKLFSFLHTAKDRVWRYSFGRIKVMSTVVEREYTPDITLQISFYMIRGFTERYFLTGYSYILENHFYFVNAPGYCFKPSSSSIFV